MKYKDEVPKKKQIRMNQFRLFPGNRVCMKYRSAYYNGVVREVYSANPEYVLGGLRAKGAGLVSWDKKAMSDFIDFLKGSHGLRHIRLKKSMWVIVELNALQKEPLQKLSKPILVRLYTYDIEERYKKGDLSIYLNW